MDRAVLEIIIRAKNQAKGALGELGENLNTATDRLGAFGRRAADVGKQMTVKLTLPIVAGATFAVNAAKDLGESINAVNVVFEEASESVLKFGETAAKSAGLSRRAFNQAVVPLGSMLRNMGFEARQAGEESIRLTQRAADMASVFNTNVDEALTAIAAGLRGETEPLKRFGVSLLDSQIKAFALANGIIKTDREMTENEKTVARIGLLYQQTSRLQGDFVNTSDDLANKTRIVRAEFENQAAALGEKLLPHALKIVDIVGKLVDKFGELSPATQDTIIKVGLFAAAAGPVLFVLGKLASTVGIVITVVKTLVALFASTAGLIVLAVAAVAVAAFLLIKNWDAVKTFFVGLWATIKDTFFRGVEAVKTFFSELPGKVGEFLSQLPGLIGFWIGLAAGTLVRLFFESIQKTIQFWAGVPGKIAEFLTRVPAIISGFVAWYFETSRRVGKAIVDGVIDFVQHLPERVAQIFRDTVERIKGSIKNAAAAARNFGDGLWKGFKKGAGISSPSFIERALMDMEAQSKSTLSAIKSDLGGFGRASVSIARPVSRAVPASDGAMPVPANPVVTNHYGDVVLNTAPAVDRYFERQGRTQELEAFGVTGGIPAGQNA